MAQRQKNYQKAVNHDFVVGMDRRVMQGVVPKRPLPLIPRHPEMVATADRLQQRPHTVLRCVYCISLACLDSPRARSPPTRRVMSPRPRLSRSPLLCRRRRLGLLGLLHLPLLFTRLP
jgi:hypothetical protein